MTHQVNLLHAEKSRKKNARPHLSEVKFERASQNWKCVELTRRRRNSSASNLNSFFFPGNGKNMANLGSQKYSNAVLLQ
jgi:hypothetical protein